MRRLVSVLFGAMVLVLIGGALRWWALSPSRQLSLVDGLLRHAYTSRRVFELRLPDAGYASVQASPQRGESSTFSKPIALLDAESRISQQLAKNPNDSQWLRMRAQAEMLGQNFDNAISTLNGSMNAQPDDASPLADLGAAYALRAVASRREIDYSAAIEMLWRFLQRSPESSMVLFNRALVYERMFLFHEALEDWQRYLKLDPAGGWANEARRHKQAIEQKVAARQKAVKSLADASGYLGALKSDRAYDSEYYLDSAITIWLPASVIDAESHEALIALARMLREKHQDKWLEDLLKEKPDAKANAHLAAAVKQNLAGDHELALEEAREAQRMYRTARSHTGELRAKYEEVYALYRSMDATKCLTLADQLAREVEPLHYGWIAGQTSMEKGNCRLVVGDEGGGRGDFELGLAEARAKGYKTLELRALGMLGGNASSLRNQIVVWQEITDHLATYWEAPYAPKGAHQFYWDLSTSSKVLGHRYAAVIFRRAAVKEISNTPNRAMEAQTRSVLASLADLAGLEDEADREFSKASELFAQCRLTPTLDRQLLSAEIWRAEFQGKSAPEAALNRLTNMLPPGKRFPTLNTERMFYQAQGHARLLRGDREGAAAAFQQAVLCSELTLASLPVGVDRGGPLRKNEDAYRGSVEISLAQNAEDALKLWALVQTRVGGEISWASES